MIRRTAEDVITIGQTLIRQKAALPHGSFLPWIEAEFAMSERAVQRFMNVAEVYGGKSASLAGLSLEAIYELAAPSTPPEVQAEVERRVAGEDGLRDWDRVLQDGPGLRQARAAKRFSR